MSDGARQNKKQGSICKKTGRLIFAFITTLLICWFVFGGGLLFTRYMLGMDPWGYGYDATGSLRMTDAEWVKHLDSLPEKERFKITTPEKLEKLRQKVKASEASAE